METKPLDLDLNSVFQQPTIIEDATSYNIDIGMIETKGLITAIIYCIVQLHPKVNDIWLTDGERPIIRENGVVKSLSQISETDGESMSKWITGLNRGELKYNLDASFVIDAHDKRVRFRVNIYMHKGRKRACLRLINSLIPAYKQLGLPDDLRTEFCNYKDGLVFFCGATSQGKSTSISSLILERSKAREEHILTLEDPIETEFPNSKAFFSQRELGTDFSSFGDGLRNALRQSPNTIYVGEIRDMETAEIALHAAETGHLVVSTLHTRRAHLALYRYALMFPETQHDEIFSLLSSVLRVTVCQRLLPSVNGGRVAMLEIMHNSPAVKPLILQKKIQHLLSVLDHSGDARNCSFTASALKLFRENKISNAVYNDVVLAYDSNPIN